MGDALVTGPAQGNGPSSVPRNLSGGAPVAGTGTGTGTSTSHMGSPRDVLNHRKARMDEQAQYTQAAERRRAEQEARLLEEAQNSHAERMNAAAQASHARTAQEAQPPGVQTSARPAARKPVGAPQEPFARAGVSSRYGSGEGQPAENARPRTTFPHAFERWETLSAHWEGLTNYWIRKLEANQDDVNRDPLSQQLSRQVTDLSAAGANLFHAVVELQRLRASSERKFTRWFFETRGEMESLQEKVAQLEHDLQEERQKSRVQVVNTQAGVESKAVKQLVEMRKELSISKEEARRAWEELGRREQAERDRTLDLQSGKTTVIAGVHVVPMTMGVPSRGGSAAGTRQMAETEERRGAESQTHEYAQAPPVQASSAAAPAAAAGHDQDSVMRDRGSYGSDSEAYSEEEFETPATHHVAYPPVPAAPIQWAQDPVDYSAGRGQYAESPSRDAAAPGPTAPTWESAVPPHHHPTRLSDVMEEDEQSRTSASQVGRHREM